MNIFTLATQLKMIYTHRANRGSQIQAISRSLNWWFKDRHHQTPIEIESFGYKLLLYPDSFQTR